MPVLLRNLEPHQALNSADTLRWTIRPCRQADTGALGALYFSAYDPGIACATPEEAIADIAASFAGEYGDLMPEASLVATIGDELVGAILTVRRAPWPDLPDCPFLIELFTSRTHRRQGIARSLLIAAMNAASLSGESRLALRLDENNADAIRLYESIGFHPEKLSK